MKKLLLIALLFISIAAFAQQTKKVDAEQKTISKVIATPNPFTSTTQISFYNNKSQKVILTVKNLLGKTIFKHIIDSKKGNNNFPFYRESLVSGIYIYSIQTDEEIISKRLVIR